MANIRKLMRLAREYEADAGRDVRGFIDFVAERDLIQEREGQAPLEAEDLDAVRLMTVHRAKGLEFPLVAVADLGKEGTRRRQPPCGSPKTGRVGIRLAQLGGGAIDSEQLARIKERQKVEDEEEEQRVFYVAMTRAEQRLILSGATDLVKLPPPEPMREPMRWIWPALAPALPDLGGDSISEVVYEGRPVRVRVRRLAPDTVEEVLPAPDRVPAPPEREPAGLEALAAPALAAVPVPAALPVSRLSYSALGRYKRCGYRFYLERALGLPDAETLDLTGGHEPEPTPGGEPPALSGLLRGGIAHLLLEEIDFGRPDPPQAAAIEALITGAGEEVREHEVADIGRLVEGFLDSPLATRLGKARSVHAERPFAFTLTPPGAGGRSLLLTGFVDVHAEEEGGGVLVVDYKTDRLDQQTPAELTERRYATQRIVYALAALRSGAERAEIAYSFLEQPDEIVSAHYTADDVSRLEEELTELAAGVVAGHFEPASDPNRFLCDGCPGRAGLCSWDPDMTTRDPEIAA